MKSSVLSTTLALFVGAFSSLIQAQTCELEAVATLETSLWGSEVSFTISDDNGILAEGQGAADYASFETTFCLDNVSGCLVLEMIDSFGDGWNGAMLDVSLPALGIPLGTFTLAEGNYQAITFGEGCESEETLRAAQTPTPSITTPQLPWMTVHAPMSAFALTSMLLFAATTTSQGNT